MGYRLVSGRRAWRTLTRGPQIIESGSDYIPATDHQISVGLRPGDIGKRPDYTPTIRRKQDHKMICIAGDLLIMRRTTKIGAPNRRRTPKVRRERPVLIVLRRSLRLDFLYLMLRGLI
jgi:hypothetical protein